MSKILLIDDDLQLANALRTWFEASGNVFEHCSAGEDGLQLLKNFEYDIVLLDWGLPTMSGIEVCRQYRKQGGKTPVIFLTGKGEIENTETGLDSGADDYLVKPFNVRELSARIRSLQRRPAAFVTDPMQLGDLSLNVGTHVMIVGEKSYQLTPKESALLEYLLRNSGGYSRSDQLLKAIWPSDGTGSVEAVRTWMKNLRRKLTDAGKPDIIQTVPGMGYIIDRDRA